MISLQQTLFSMVKTESTPSKITTKTRVSTFTTVIQHSSRSTSCSNQRRKINKINPDQKRRSKALIDADGMILYIENPKHSIRKLLYLISAAKLQDSKSTQKSLAFLYTNSEKSQREIKESIPFTNETKRITYLGINLPKPWKESYDQPR